MGADRGAPPRELIEPGSRTDEERYPPIGDYGLIGDCHSAALVSRRGSIDWCCLPRFDSGSVFGRLLDRKQGGYLSIEPADARATAARRYVEGTMVLETTFETPTGRARVTDCFAMRRGGRTNPRRELLRVIDGLDGTVSFRVRIVPRFDYGDTSPWIHRRRPDLHTAVGSDVGLVIWSDIDLEPDGLHDLSAEFDVRAGDRRHLSVRFARPEKAERSQAPDGHGVDERIQETLTWWRRWAASVDPRAPRDAVRSALVLKALVHAPTGGIIASPTTSLPSPIGGARNWDYRYCWIRDSAFAVRSLGEVGFHAEANGFRRFVERSAAGSAEELTVLFDVGGGRFVPELELGWLEGYRGSKPVRVGNGAATQVQLDLYGELLDLAWRWHRRGNAPDEEYWRFLVEIVDRAADLWHEPDRGIWEVRGEPEHFVHSKAMCWSALDRGIRLAEATSLDAPVERWTRARDEIHRAIQERGYDERRGVFVRSFGSTELDAALLLLPEFGFVPFDDPRMIRTTDAILNELGQDGFIRRYDADDGLEGREGVFVACTFWLAVCLARQGRTDEARAAYERACSEANDLGLFAEQFEPATGEMLGNFPQGLSHLAHVEAAAALAGIPEPD